jgi:alkylated DNA repair dioxygenase AlkB
MTKPDAPARPGSLFGTDVPDGFHYRDDFITPEDETTLVDAIARQVEFSTFEMRGVAARRRVAFFGRTYQTRSAIGEVVRSPNAEAGIESAAPPIPAFLVPLRDRLAEWAGVDRGAFVMALINQYPPGAPIGWHRDAPQYGIVGGVSLLAACRMKLRPYERPGARESRQPRGPRTATHEITLERRSAYLMTGAARNAYEHHIPAVTALRYSITFRTARL